jgi:putative colanic acid biosynthesis UDP-glucose lipid carrier transferase
VRVISDLIGIVDGAVAAVTGLVTGVFYDTFVHGLSGGIARVAGLSLLGAVIFTALGFRANAYDLNKLRRFTHEGAALLARWSIAVLILVAAAFLIKIADATSRGWLLVWYGASCLDLLLMRIGWRQIARRVFQSSPALRRRVAVVGANETAQRVCAQMRRLHAGVQIVGVYDDLATDNRLAEIGPAGMVGTVDDLIAQCRTESIDDVLITLPWSEESKIGEIIRRLRVLPCGVHLCPGVLGSQFTAAKMGILADAHVLEVTRRSMEGWATIWKILQDRLVAGFGVVLLLPLFLVIALLIKLESRGPVFFRQRRHGFNHHVFYIYKFRTMTVCEDGPAIVQAKCQDQRVTKIGAFLRRSSLDELPQLLNVLKGEMSLVGPRPHALAHDNEYARIIEGYSVRQRVLPGITGWAQVNGCRGETETPEKMRQRIKHDLYYVENWSPLFDLKILALTLRVLLVPKNAY